MRFLPILVFLLFSCRSNLNIFSSKSLHEQYGNRLKKAGLENTELGKSWFFAAKQALEVPRDADLPYKETGYFAAEKPAAAGLKFNAKRGEKLIISINKNSTIDFTLFAEMWQVNEGSDLTLVESINTAAHT